MGCDIHLFVEVKKDGEWQHHDWRENYRDGWYDEEQTDKKYNYSKMFDDPIYIGRNYDLFAILANVRNGYGFAGVDTGDGFVPISEPKGLPDDVTDEVQKESDKWDCDGHSHSYFTVEELLNYNWNQTTKHRGVCTPGEYKVFREKGKPESWCGGVSGGGIKIVPNFEMDKLIKQGKVKTEGDRFNAKYYTPVEWKEPYSESAKQFLTQTIPALQKLGDPKDVRIVFWFDN